jgi:hypothetical protein
LAFGYTWIGCPVDILSSGGDMPVPVTGVTAIGIVIAEKFFEKGAKDFRVERFWIRFNHNKNDMEAQIIISIVVGLVVVCFIVSANLSMGDKPR